MAVSKAKKSQILDKLDDQFARAKSVVFVANSGLSADEAVEVRKACHEANLNYTVAKRTMLRLSASKQGVELGDDVLEGPVGAIFSYEDEIAPASVAYKFVKGDDAKLAFTGGILNGEVLNKDSVMKLAKLPSREQLVAQLLSSLNAPVSGFANVCAGPLRGFAQAIKAISEKA